MLVVEIGVFGIAVSRLTVRIVIGYSTVCAILLGLALYFAYRVEWSLIDGFDSFVSLGVYLAIVGHFLVNGLGRFLEAASIADRGTALKLYAWVYSPMLFATILLGSGYVLEDAPFSVTIPGLRSTAFDQAFRWVALLASVIWVLVSAPIARLWATNKAQDPEAFLNAEELLFVSEHQREFEARVSIPSYYALILGFLALSFLILDSIIGEVFERMTGISGYIGAVIASVVVATMLYPIHKRFNTFVAHLREIAQESGRADALNALKSTIDSTRRFLFAESGVEFIFVAFVFVVLAWGFGSLGKLS